MSKDTTLWCLGNLPNSLKNIFISHEEILHFSTEAKITRFFEGYNLKSYPQDIKFLDVSQHSSFNECEQAQFDLQKPFCE